MNLYTSDPCRWTSATGWRSRAPCRASSLGAAFSRATLRRIAAFARPHRRALVAFLVFSVVAAVLTVATPVLAGQVVDEIIDGGDEGRVIVPGRAHRRASPCSTPSSGVAERWQSSRIGEGLILDLRRAVFAHVQRMPVAFFTRTRTGALVSRLDNDVIGAQRAFTVDAVRRREQRHRPRCSRWP